MERAKQRDGFDRRAPAPIDKGTHGAKKEKESKRKEEREET